MTWTALTGEDGFADGRGTDGGIVVADEEDGTQSARITLERDKVIAPAGITCGLYGWMVHTRHFAELDSARQQFEAMKPGLAELVEMVPLLADPEVEAKTETLVRAISVRAISAFVEKFP